MKMSYRHRLALYLLMVAMVSVFFVFSFSSCGIPTYWQPKNTTVISSNSSSSVSTNELSFNVNVSFYTGDDGSNAPQIGLVLLYVYSNTIYGSTIDSELVKTFNNEYRGTIPNGLSTLESEFNTQLWDFTVDSSTYNVYAFTDASGNSISSPHYNRNLSSNTDISKSFTLKLNTDITTNKAIGANLSDGTTASDLNFGLDSSNLTNLQDSDYIYVYAAISAQGENYSNIYWSNLTYVGSFSGFKSNNN